MVKCKEMFQLLHRMYLSLVADRYRHLELLSLRANVLICSLVWV